MPKRTQASVNRSASQRIRRINERAESVLDRMDKQDEINENLFALTMQNERSIKALNARLTSIEQQARDGSY